MAKQTDLNPQQPVEAEVVDYLLENPAFFEGHAELLPRMKLFHESGRAVSLIERQVEILREENDQLTRKLQKLVQVARDNESLGARIQKLAVVVLESESLDELLTSVEDMLRSQFDAEQVVIRLLDVPAGGLGGIAAKYRVAADGELASSFKVLLQSRRVRCGRLLDEQLELLFGRAAAEVRSVAVVPLYGGSEFGLVALGSRNAGRFQPAMGVLFLEQIGELISAALKLRRNA
ncbi:MAG: DUF484 family protein [Gammaproteobacteria bacterium]|nr:DUF484 family protein [Gammaproteobacteria bacterium]